MKKVFKNKVFLFLSGNTGVLAPPLNDSITCVFVIRDIRLRMKKKLINVTRPDIRIIKNLLNQ